MIEVESKWENVSLTPSLIREAVYMDTDTVILKVQTSESMEPKEYELYGFASTKLFRMTGMKKKTFEDELSRTEKTVESSQQLLDAIHEREENDPLILRILKEDDSVRSVVGKTYIPVDMEELEAHAELIMEEGGFSNLDVERYKTYYARGQDYTRYLFMDNTSDGQVGDVVAIGLQIKNNELGTRGISVCLYFQRLECSNGMCSYKTEQTLTETHLGDKTNLLEEFDIAVTRIIDRAWDILEVIDGSQRMDFTPTEMNNLIDNWIKDKEISGKVGCLIKEAILDEEYGAHSNNAWGLINAITGISSHKVSHGVKDKLEHLASDMMDLRDKSKLGKKLLPVEFPEGKEPAIVLK